MHCVQGVFHQIMREGSGECGRAAGIIAPVKPCAVMGKGGFAPEILSGPLQEKRELVSCKIYIGYLRRKGADTVFVVIVRRAVTRVRQLCFAVGGDPDILYAFAGTDDDLNFTILCHRHPTGGD